MAENIITAPLIITDGNGNSVTIDVGKVSQVTGAPAVSSITANTQLRVSGSPNYIALPPTNIVQTPKVLAYSTVAQSLANGVNTNLTWTNTTIDFPGLSLSPAQPDRLTVKVGGFYHIVGLVAFASNSSGIRYLRVKVNGAHLVPDVLMVSAPVTGNITSLQVAVDWPLNAGDYVQFEATQSSGVTLTTWPGFYFGQLYFLGTN